MRGFLVCFCSAALGGLAAGTFGSGPMFRLEAREAADGNHGGQSVQVPVTLGRGDAREPEKRSK